MKSAKLPAIIAAVMGAAVVVGVMVLPGATQSDQDVADAQADLHTAMAMRLLHSYQVNVSQLSWVRGQLGRRLGTIEEPVAVPPRGDDVGTVIGDRLDQFQSLSKELRDLARKGPATKLDQRIRGLVSDTAEIPQMPRLDLGKDQGAISKAVNAAAKRVDKLVKENAKLLKQAQREAEEALRVQVGQAATRDNVNANDVCAHVFHAQAEVKREEANALRSESFGTRARAVRHVGDAIGLLGRIRQAKDRLPTKLLESLAGEKDDLQKRLAQAKKRAGTLQGIADGLAKQIKDAEAVAQAGGKAVLALEAKGYDPKNPTDVKRYVDEYAKQSSVAGNARLKAAALTRGTLDGVELDDAHGGDPIKDQYVNVPGGKGRSVVKGLVAYQRELDGAGKEVADIEEMLKGNAARTEKIESLGQKLDAYRKSLVKRKAELDGRIESLIVQADKQSEIALKAESEALALLKKAANKYKSASRAAKNRGGDLISDSSMEDMPKDKDTEAVMNIGQADVSHARALIYLQQVRDLRWRIAAINAAATAQVTGVDKAKIEELGDALATATEESVKAIEESLKKLEPRNTRGMGKNYQWIPQVNLAAANDLKSLLASGDAAADAFSEALDQYGQAVEGREGSPYLKPYVAAAKRLREAGAAEDEASDSQPSDDDESDEAKEPDDKKAEEDAKPAKAEPKSKAR